MTQGKLLGIAIRAKSHAPMQEFECIEITPAGGCAGDFRGKTGDRQVSVLSRQAWDAACSELGKTLPWTSRRANLLIEGVDLENSASKVLWIGNVLLEIKCETDPCQRMTQAAQGLREALTPAWRGGVCCRVIKGGRVSVGDSVTLRDRSEV